MFMFPNSLPELQHHYSALRNRDGVGAVEGAKIFVRPQIARVDRAGDSHILKVERERLGLIVRNVVEERQGLRAATQRLLPNLRRADAMALDSELVLI